MQKPFERKLRINNFIRVPEVQVIGPEGEKLGVMKLHEALQYAQDRNMDVVEVGPEAKPPLVKILDYGKFQYQKERREKGHKKSTAQEVKTVQIGFRTDVHDMNVRATQVNKFLTKGYRVKIDLRLRGREKGMGTLGRTKLEQFMQFITEAYEVDSPIKAFPGGLGTLIKPGKRK